MVMALIFTFVLLGSELSVLLGHTKYCADSLEIILGLNLYTTLFGSTSRSVFCVFSLSCTFYDIILAANINPVLMVLVFISGIPVCATSRKICIDYNGT
jgi:hypothetical protein